MPNCPDLSEGRSREPGHRGQDLWLPPEVYAEAPPDRANRRSCEARLTSPAWPVTCLQSPSPQWPKGSVLETGWEQWAGVELPFRTLWALVFPRGPGGLNVERARRVGRD